MKKFYLSILFAISFVSLTVAQNKDTKKADDLYNDYAFAEAIEAYNSLLKRGKADTYVYKKLAQSYYQLGDFKNAESLYARATKAEDAAPEIIYEYAQTLKANGKVSKYETAMRRFVTAQPSDSRAQAFNKNPNFLSSLLAQEPLFTVTNIKGLNSQYADYGSHIFENTLYFASARNTSRKNHDLNNEPFLDIYTVTVDGSQMSAPGLLNGDVNTKYHEGTVAISPDGKRMYFDRNDYFEKDFDKDENGLNQINLYTAEKIEGSWVNIKSAPFNSDNFSTGHPALSVDGKTLYFSSDRPGGKGGSDIYKVAINEDNTFGEIQPLGNEINTEGKEVFPYVAYDGTLYFSSDGHLGLGGLDVFAFAKAETVKNLGPGVNSSADDFGISLSNNKQNGYISSNRQGGQGGDDIYRLGQLPPCDVDVLFTVQDPEGNGISKAVVTVVNNDSNARQEDTATTTGKYLFESKCNRSYTITAKAEGYKEKTRTLPVGKEDVNSSLTLDPIVVAPEITETEVILNPIYFDFDKANIRPSAAAELDRLVSVMQQYPTMVISAESHTDIRGSDQYNELLSQRRADSMMKYVVSKGIAANRISSIGKGESDLAVDCAPTCTEEQHQQNRRSVFRIVSR